MKKTTLHLWVAACTLLGASTSFAASNVSYNYAGIQYFDVDLDDYDCSQDGIAINGSLELNSDFFALGSYGDSSGNRGCGAETISAGVGYKTVFGADSSIYGALSYENTSPDNGSSDSGIIAAAGLRGFFQPNLEGKIEVAHHTAYDGNTQLNGGVAFWFAPQFAATGDVSLGSDASSVAVGLRLNF